MKNYINANGTKISEETGIVGVIYETKTEKYTNVTLVKFTLVINQEDYYSYLKDKFFMKK